MNPRKAPGPVPGPVPCQGGSRAREGPVPAGVKDDVSELHFIQSSTSRLDFLSTEMVMPQRSDAFSVALPWWVMLL